MKDKKQKQENGSTVSGGATGRIKKPGLKQKQDKLKVKCRATRKVLQLWKEETDFIDGVFALLPTTGEVDEDLDEYLLDLSESEETKKRDKFLKQTQRFLDEQKATAKAEVKDEGQTNGDVNSGHATEQISIPAKKGKGTFSPKPNREELLERLHAKMALVAQKKNSNKAKLKREKKTEGKKERRKDAKKQFISKTNPNLKGSKAGVSATTKTESTVPSATNGDIEKTPLRTPAVKKADGQVVYSKFDFIAPAKQSKGKAKVTEILKNVEKTEGKIARLEAMGKKHEAVEVSEGQKWMTALKRAEGQKVRDDPNLLKKTIKKDKKLKESRKKKWTERVETMEKDKEMRVKKRKANMEGRREEKKKKQKKLQRKRGRIV